MPISKFSLSMKGRRLEISYGNEGTQEAETVMVLTLRSGEEAAS